MNPDRRRRAGHGFLLHPSSFILHPLLMREPILAEMTHASVRAQSWQAAVLPFGATEPHNLHMPYGTDTFQVEELGRRACGRAWQKGARVALLPAIPFGVNTNHL